jgi:hypothetical protein
MPMRFITSPGPPDRQIWQYTTTELAQRRRELEQAQGELPDTAPVQADITRWLEEVEDEERDRERIKAANGSSGPGRVG